MLIVKTSNDAIKKAVNVLSSGGIIIYPTETLYGIGVDATNESAVNLLNSYKNRPLGKPYSVAVLNKKMALKYVYLNEQAEKLYRNFLPGPLTIISKGKHLLAKGVESESGNLGIRIPNYKMVLQIIKLFKKPITASSANASYQKRPYKISDILNNISEKQKNLIDLIIDAGELPKNEPSTVVDTTMDDLVVLRQGNIKIKSIEEIFSNNEESTQNFGKELWQKFEKYFGKRPIVFALEGEMGAGKTQFTKGLAKAMGISDTIVSPTFDIVREYKEFNIKLYHIDSWRVSNSEEMISLGFNKMLSENNVVVCIEWADKIIDILKEYAEDTIIVWVKIKYGDNKNNKNERIISWGSL